MPLVSVTSTSPGAQCRIKLESVHPQNGTVLDFIFLLNSEINILLIPIFNALTRKQTGLFQNGFPVS